jgi:hypothetical protein
MLHLKAPQSSHDFVEPVAHNNDGSTIQRFLALNSGTSTASGHAAYLRTHRHFSTFGTYPTYVDLWVRETNPTATNVIHEWGLFVLDGTGNTTANRWNFL